MMQGKYVFRIVVIVAVLLAAVIGGGEYASYRKALIEKERQIEVERIEQEQKTERTEERSQFWQSLVPWGEDEAEEAK